MSTQHIDNEGTVIAGCPHLPDDGPTQVAAKEDGTNAEATIQLKLAEFAANRDEAFAYLQSLSASLDTLETALETLASGIVLMKKAVAAVQRHRLKEWV